nr:hypothetical protein Iba_chr07aCG11670 [Ipomoea batatas]
MPEHYEGSCIRENLASTKLIFVFFTVTLGIRSTIRQRGAMAVYMGPYCSMVVAAPLALPPLASSCFLNPSSHRLFSQLFRERIVKHNDQHSAEDMKEAQFKPEGPSAEQKNTFNLTGPKICWRRGRRRLKTSERFWTSITLPGETHHERTDELPPSDISNIKFLMSQCIRIAFRYEHRDIY